MRDKKVWLITGAGRGMGADIARAALAAGGAVVATARKADSVTAALGEHDDLLAERSNSLHASWCRPTMAPHLAPNEWTAPLLAFQTSQPTVGGLRRQPDHVE